MKNDKETARIAELSLSSDQYFILLFENNPTPMWLIDKDESYVIYANKAVVRQYGYTLGELLQKTMKDLKHKDEPDEPFEGVDGIVKHAKRNGEPIYVKISSRELELGGKGVILLATTDVTAEFDAKRALAKSRTHLQAILEIPDGGYALLDTGLRFFAFNQKAIEFANEKYQIQLEENISLTHYFPFDKFPKLINAAIRVLNGDAVKYEVDYELSQGKVLWYKIYLTPIKDDSSNITGIMITINDITERKNARKDLCSAYNRIKDQIKSIQTMTWKQSHLIRQPLANIKGLLQLLADNPSDDQVLTYIRSEFDKMDSVIIEMANDAPQY